MGIESFAKQEQRPDYPAMRQQAIEVLQSSGSKFRVERTEEIKPGIHKLEYDWEIAAITPERVLITKIDEKTGELIKKNVSIDKFAQWQFAEVNSAERQVEKLAEKEGLKDIKAPGRKQLREKVYKELHISPELLKVHEAFIRGTVGA